MEKRYPELKTRVQSVFIDGVLMILMMIGAGWLFDKTGWVSENDGWVKAVTFVGIWGVYGPLATTMGCTAGNYMMNVRVRSVDNHDQKINILQAYLRFVIKMLLGWISFLTIHFNEQKRAMHDLAAGSVMIEK